MQDTLVLTVIGPDRPGIVEAVSKAIEGNGGNWLASRMCNLGGQFAGILSLEVPSERKQALLEALGALSGEGMEAIVHEGLAREQQVPCPRLATLEVVGHDRQGIVKRIARTLAAKGINVEELTSERSSAPMSGEMIFTARIKICVPEGGDMDALRKDIEAIESDLMVDVILDGA